MITRVYGTVNQDEIIFDNSEGDLWQAEVPFSDDGMYICSIYAENEAGNRAYICKALFAITGHQMKMYVFDNPYQIDVEDRGYKGDPELNKFASEFADLLYKSGVAQKLEFKGRQVERGYRCGYILCDGNSS